MLNVLQLVRDRLRGSVPKGMKRSKLWPKVRAAHRKKQNYCAICGTKKSLEVHHIIPFSLDPSLELEPDNLITLCDGKGLRGSKSCHKLFGHHGDWRRFNPNILHDASEWSAKIKK